MDDGYLASFDYSGISMVGLYSYVVYGILETNLQSITAMNLIAYKEIYLKKSIPDGKKHPAREGRRKGLFFRNKTSAPTIGRRANAVI